MSAHQPPKVWLSGPLVASAAHDWLVCAHTDAVWWTHLSTGARTVVVRAPDTAPWDPLPPRPLPTGGVVDVGARLVAPSGDIRVEPGRSRSCGHAVVERRGEQLVSLDGSPLPLPEAARCSGARPWPVRAGWAWVDGNTVYRRAPDGRVHVAGRSPGGIRAWDVGPGGAVWFVSVGCLWLAGPGRFARPAPEPVVEALGTPVSALEPGALVFADDGRSLVAVEAGGAHVITLGARPRVANAVGEVVGLTAGGVAFPSADEPALACASSDAVVHVSRTHVTRIDGSGVRSCVPVDLPGSPVAVGMGPRDTLTVLTARGAVAVDRHGARAEPDTSVLHPDPNGPVVTPTPAGPVWWSRSGQVVPLSRARLAR